jgi:hypothetical protein
VRRLSLAFICLLLGGMSFAAAQTTLPRGKGTPVQIKVAVAFVDLVSFKENTGIYNATVDVRLRWQDLRLRLPPQEANEPPKVYRGSEAQAQAARIWVPNAEIANQRGKASYETTGLRLFPDGRVELIKRTGGDFTTNYNVERFPFDRQRLRLEVAVRDLPSDLVSLEFDQEDLDFSRAAASANLDGWGLGLVTLRSEPLSGWHGVTHPRVVASLQIVREPAMIVAGIFIPLFASLLIPMLAIWLNRVDDGRFRIETFELVNIIIGGLFAVIALNFTVNSVYEVLGSGDNPINRLFALNYFTLGIALLNNVLLFRFGVIERMFGRYVQEQLYFFLCWAIPALAMTVAASVVLVAIV